MIPIELPNGKTIMLTAEQWLSMSDEDFQNLIAQDAGYYIDNPFDKSIDRIVDRVRDNVDLDVVIPDIPDELDEDQIKKIESEKKSKDAG